jgi:hypothetical protein
VKTGAGFDLVATLGGEGDQDRAPLEGDTRRRDDVVGETRRIRLDGLPAASG